MKLISFDFIPYGTQLIYLRYEGGHYQRSYLYLEADYSKNMIVLPYLRMVNLFLEEFMYE